MVFCYHIGVICMFSTKIPSRCKFKVRVFRQGSPSKIYPTIGCQSDVVRDDP